MFATYYMKAIKILYLRCCYSCEIGILKGKYIKRKIFIMINISQMWGFIWNQPFLIIYLFILLFLLLLLLLLLNIYHDKYLGFIWNQHYYYYSRTSSVVEEVQGASLHVAAKVIYSELIQDK